MPFLLLEKKYSILCEFQGLNGKNRAFPRSILKVIRVTIKWIVNALGFESSFFSARSIRAGGASTLFANRIDLDTIRRFGRWRSGAFHVYLYGDSLNLRGLSSALCVEENLMDQIRTTNDSRVFQDHPEGSRSKTKPVFRSRVGGYNTADGVTSSVSRETEAGMDDVLTSDLPVFTYDYPLSARTSEGPPADSDQGEPESWASKETVCVSADGLCRTTTRKNVKMFRRHRENVCPNADLDDLLNDEIFWEIKEVVKEEKIEPPDVRRNLAKKEEKHEDTKEEKFNPFKTEYKSVKRSRSGSGGCRRSG